MSDVTWVAHPRYDGYEVSSDGRVRSIDRAVLVKKSSGEFRRRVKGRELALIPHHKHGMMVGVISVDGRHINFGVHVMVCETFHGPRPSCRHEVRHLNGIATDNRAENLLWGTHAENMQDMLRHGTNRNARKTHCKRGHEFTPENTRHCPGKPHVRFCGECRKESNKRSWARQLERQRQKRSA